MEPLNKDWKNVKCHPGIIPFAGMINKDPNDTVFQSTTKNFSVCTNLILKSIVDCGLEAGKDIVLALDCAASEFFTDGKYVLKGENKSLDSDDFVDLILRDALDHRFL